MAHSAGRCRGSTTRRSPHHETAHPAGWPGSRRRSAYQQTPHFGDARAHQTTADDADIMECHGCRVPAWGSSRSNYRLFAPSAVSGGDRSGKSRSHHSFALRAISGFRICSPARRSTRRILPEIVFGNSLNSIRRILFIRRQSLATECDDQRHRTWWSWPSRSRALRLSEEMMALRGGARTRLASTRLVIAW